jgi:tellurite resistance protein
MHFRAIPASFFGMPLGMLALGIAWRSAGQIWQLAPVIGESMIWIGSVLWALLFVSYAAKWAWQRASAEVEFEHPVQCCFVGLAGVVGSLASIGVTPYSRELGFALFVIGGLWTIIFALYRTGRLWMGGRDPEATTPILYLPTVAGGFVTASAAVSSGHADWGQLAFGAGLFAWLAIESVLLHRLLTSPAIAPALRPTLGIQLAPPAVGAVACLNLHNGSPDLLVHAMVGYALLQALLLLRLWPWLRSAGATPAWWAFSFGAAALPTAAVKMVALGETGAVATLAPWLFVLGNVVIGCIIIMTCWLAICGRLLPASAPVKAA